MYAVNVVLSALMVLNAAGTNLFAAVLRYSSTMLTDILSNIPRDNHFSFSFPGQKPGAGKNRDMYLQFTLITHCQKGGGVTVPLLVQSAQGVLV